MTDEIEAFVYLIVRLLLLVPPGLQESVVERVSQLVDEDAAEPFRVTDAQKMRSTPPPPDVSGLMAEAVLLFTREIVTQHDPREAAQLLFSRKRGPGSGLLLDYLDRLPGIKIDVERAMGGCRAEGTE